jgi:hypothetical protein
VSRSISHTLSSLGFSIPTNRVPTAVINVDSNIATATMIAPITMGIEVPKGARSGVAARYPGYSVGLFGD